MLYEIFFNWLTRRYHCEHAWVETKVTYDNGWFSGYEFKHHMKCSKCGKKIKRAPRDVPENTLKNDVYYIS